MKSALQIQLDNQYEILRVAHLKRKEQSAPVHTLPVKPILHRPLKYVLSKEVQQFAGWDVAWFNHYE